MRLLTLFIEHPGKAWRDYLALADMGGSNGYLETLRMANLTPPYEDGAVARAISYGKSVLEDYIEKA